jgi:hypothetical protein
VTTAGQGSKTIIVEPLINERPLHPAMERPFLLVNNHGRPLASEMTSIPSYVHACLVYLGDHPAFEDRTSCQLNLQSKIQDCLTHLIAVRKLGWNTGNVAMCALQCFSIKCRKRTKLEANIPPRPRRRTLPQIRSKSEVARLSEHAKDLRPRALRMIIHK